MTADWNYLNDVAARRVIESPSTDDGKRLHEVTEKARMEISVRAYPLLAITFLSMLIFTVYFFSAAWELIDFRGYVHFIYKVLGCLSVYLLPTFPRVVACCISGTTSVLMMYLIQHQEPLKSWFRLSNSCYPEKLEALFDDLQSKDWQAKNKEGRLPAHLFSSSWRTLLAAGPEVKFHRLLVWDKKGKAYKGDIEVKYKAHESENRPFHGEDRQEHLEETRNETKSIDHEEKSVIRHWRSSVPPDQREVFCTTFATLGRWNGEDAAKIRIVLQAVFLYDGPLEKHNGKEKLGPLVEAANAALRRALKNGQINTLWLSDAREPDPTSALEKMLGDAKTHKYTNIRIKAFESLRISRS
jgi:hypothetical protein